MKTKVLSLVALFMMGAFTVFAGNKTEKFKVYGNCGMCETRIEKTATSIDGVEIANWNSKEQTLTINYDSTRTSSDVVQYQVSKIGHDTEKLRADETAYNALPGCCQYRSQKKQKRSGSSSSGGSGGCH